MMSEVPKLFKERTSRVVILMKTKKRSSPHFKVIFVGILGGDQWKQKKIDLVSCIVENTEALAENSPPGVGLDCGKIGLKLRGLGFSGLRLGLE